MALVRDMPIIGVVHGAREVPRLIYLRDLMAALVTRDLKLRYKRSLLGAVWSLLNPFAQLVVLYFVFGLILPLNIPHYTSFLFTGLLAWSWFHSALQFATGSIVDNRDLIKRPGFPTAILPAVAVSSHLLHFLIALPILLVCVTLDVNSLTVAVAALPLIVVLQFLFTLSVAYFVATVHVTFRDTQYLVALMLQLWFYVTPIFYDIAALPEQYRRLLNLNPMAVLIEAYRSILIRGEWPDAHSLIVMAFSSAALLCFGYYVSVRASARFAEEL
jgi:homopolymeric O-antigen transport system permease protein